MDDGFHERTGTGSLWQGFDAEVADLGVPGLYAFPVHQAAGLLTVQLDASIDGAMIRLRAAAYSAGKPVNQMAADMVEGRTRLTQGGS